MTQFWRQSNYQSLQHGRYEAAFRVLSVRLSARLFVCPVAYRFLTRKSVEKQFALMFPRAKVPGVQKATVKCPSGLPEVKNIKEWRMSHVLCDDVIYSQCLRRSASITTAAYYVDTVGAYTRSGFTQTLYSYRHCSAWWWVKRRKFFDGAHRTRTELESCCCCCCCCLSTWLDSAHHGQ